MDTATVGNAAIEYEVHGSGEPLLLIHGALIADAWQPILKRLAARYRTVTYHRRGFRSSAPARAESTIAEQASDALGLLDHLGIDRAHVAGHSFGGAVALQVALDAPERVQSLGLLEPGLMAAPSAAEFGEGVAAIAELFQSGDREGALEAFLTAVGGENPVARLNQRLDPSWYQHALDDLPTAFASDLPALGSWTFDEEHAREVSHPALTVLGTATFPLCAESHELLVQWLPAAEPFELPGATHMLHIDDPDGMADGLSAFLARHPMGA